MGSKVESYVDDYGNEIRDNDTVVYSGKDYKVRYISNFYVNLEGSGSFDWLHLPFCNGKPFLKEYAKTINPSPVRETTIVKKEIVPGTYGRVYVTCNKQCGVHACMNKSEVAEAIKTLQLIHDAME